MNRLLLTGASGFLGWNICNTPQNDWEITGITNRKSLDIPGIALLKADLTDHKGLRQLFRDIKPQGLIHTAAHADPNYCQQHAEETYAINVEVPILLAQLCAEAAIPFVFTSTDLVFDGKKGNYPETDAVNPVNTYGEQKVKAEESVLKAYPEAAVCRMPLMFGDGGPVAKSFIQPFLQKMRAGEALSLFYDEYRSVIGGRSAASGLLLALDKFHGMYHLGGRERLSRYDFGLLLQKVFNLPQATISALSQKEVNIPAPRPADVSLDSSKAYKMGYAPMKAEEELRLL